MRKLLNTLFVTTQGAVLVREREAIVVRVEKEEKLKIPIHLLNGVICFGNVTLTPFCMGLCAENNVLISFLTEYGNFMARVCGKVNGNVLLRKAQYFKSDNLEESAVIAGRIVTSKIANCRTLLLRTSRDHPSADTDVEMAFVAQTLGNIIQGLKSGFDLDSVRGKEGEGALRYFSIFNHLIVAQKNDFVFSGRSRRPPLDRVNALISFLYTLLVHDVSSACEAVGLDPAVGFLHRDRPGRPSLALDMMEEFRAMVADRVALTLINRKQVKADDFRTLESGAVVMSDDAKKTVLNAWQERKREEIHHPYLNERVEVGMLPYVQALLLARHLRGDIDDYPAFIWR